MATNKKNKHPKKTFSSVVRRAKAQKSMLKRRPAPVGSSRPAASTLHAAATRENGGPARFIPIVAIGSVLLLIILAVAMMFARPTEKVQVDFLVSSHCAYCDTARPVVENVASQMNGQVQLNYLDEANRATNATVAERYTYYTDTGLFGGFPTLVAHGPKGENALVGLRPQTEVKTWMCAQFVQPPSGCS